MMRIVTWGTGLLLCTFFVFVLLPMDGPPGHQWVMPLGTEGYLFFGGGCFVILLITYFIDDHNYRKNNRINKDSN